MDVPAPAGGRVAEVLVKVGDRVSQGSPILKLELAGAPAGQASRRKAGGGHQDADVPARARDQAGARAFAAVDAFAARRQGLPPPVDFGSAHASPAVRRLARELDVDLTKLKGSGEKGRITKEDVKRALAPAGAPAAGAGIPEIPAQDFSKFGPVETSRCRG